MKRIYVNEQWCLGCHLCEYYCAFAASGEKDMAKALKHLVIHPRIHIEEKDGVSFAVSCRHCEDPVCVKSCITGALTRKDGVISIDHDKCVGCYNLCAGLRLWRALAFSGWGDAKVRIVHEDTRGRSAVRKGVPERRNRL